jgi:hypothetical protein
MHRAKVQGICGRGDFFDPAPNGFGVFAPRAGGWSLAKNTSNHYPVSHQHSAQRPGDTQRKSMGLFGGAALFSEQRLRKCRILRQASVQIIVTV